MTPDFNHPNSFTAPTPQQVRRHLERYPARRALGVWANMPILALILVICLVVGVADYAYSWVVLMGCSGFMVWRWLRDRGLRLQAGRAQELAIGRNWQQSLRMAWRALPSLMTVPELHGRVVAIIAHDLDQLKAYDAAIIAYDYLIKRLPAEHPGSIQFRIQRALAELANDHLTDADQTLRRLHYQVEPYKGTPTGAAYCLAVLTQQIRTNHYADATESEATLLDDLRPLGPDAGLGYGLMALAYAKLAKSPDADPTLFQRAQVWWARATHLLPSRVLTNRLPDLEIMTRLHAPAPGQVEQLRREPSPQTDPPPSTL